MEAAEPPGDNTVAQTPPPPPPPRRFVGRRAADAAAAPSDAPASGASGALQPLAAAPRRVVHQQVPRDILEDEGLAAAVAALPGNYNFEARRPRDATPSVGSQRSASWHGRATS